MRRILLPDAGLADRHAVLGRLLQFGVEPADLRLLQPGLQGGVQGHAAVRDAVLLLLLEDAGQVPLAAGR